MTQYFHFNLLNLLQLINFLNLFKFLIRNKPSKAGFHPDLHGIPFQEHSVFMFMGLLKYELLN